MNCIKDLKTLVDIPSTTDSSTCPEIIGLGRNYASLITKEELDIEGNKNTSGEKISDSPNTLIKQEFYEYDNSYNLLSIKQEEIDIKEENLCQPTNEADSNCVGKSRVNKQLAEHAGAKQFSCISCDYKSADKSNLKIHLSKHTGEKPFSCTFCDYKSVKEHDLKRHLIKHTGIKPFSCPFCDYKCVRKCYLNQHLRNHTGEKPFSCTYCDYKSVREYDLKRHLPKHTGVKSFSCTSCDYKSVTKFNLKRHLLKHTGEKPFCGTICGNKYTQKRSLIYHMKSHDNETFTFKEFVPSVTGKILAVEGNEMSTEDEYELARTLKLDLEQDQYDLQIDSQQKIMIKQEEVDIKEEPF